MKPLTLRRRLRGSRRGKGEGEVRDVGMSAVGAQAISPRRLDATGAFDLCGDIDFHTMNDHKVVLVIREIGILF